MSGWDDRVSIWARAKKEAVSDPTVNPDLVEQYRAIFKQFDRDGDGWISVLDLQKVFARVRRPEREEELRARIRSLDLDRDGRIGVEEFVAMMGDTTILPDD